jgi:uncharacterized sodium:solute symporter family permease YidK
MMEWFKAGGFGMIALLAVGAGSIGYGVKAVIDPTAERIAALRSLPGVLLAMALFGFGTGLWAVNQALSSEAFAKAHELTDAQKPLIGILGITEAAQCITLGALLALATYVLRGIAETKRAKSGG